jgi:hypothetical protein
MIWDVHPGSGSRIRILIFYPSRILDPGDNKAPDPVSGSSTLDSRRSILVCFVSLSAIAGLKGLSHEMDLAFEDMYGQF